MKKKEYRSVLETYGEIIRDLLLENYKKGKEMLQHNVVCTGDELKIMVARNGFIVNKHCETFIFMTFDGVVNFVAKSFELLEAGTRLACLRTEKEVVQEKNGD